MAQSYPAQPIRMLTAEPGGGSEVAVGVLAQNIAIAGDPQGRMDNRVGGINIAAIAANAAPEGCTLPTDSNPLWMIPLMCDKTP